MVDYTRTTTRLLSINDVSLKFGDRLILRDVNAEINDIDRPDCAQGQVICFLGPSGIGKTQMSRVIAGLQRPTTGTVTLFEGLPVHRGGVGMVPQNYPLFEFMTVIDNIVLAGRMGKGMTKAQAREKAEPFIQAFTLQEYLSLYPSALSGGTRQRVAIVRQLMCAEHYLVMDEPFSGLDPVMKRMAGMSIIKLSLLDTFNTVIIVTHDIAFGASVADTIWLMGQEQDTRGSFLPGSRLVEQYDLAALDLCWRPGIRSEPRFQALVAELENRFETLKKF